MASRPDYGLIADAVMCVETRIGNPESGSAYTVHAHWWHYAEKRCIVLKEPEAEATLSAQPMCHVSAAPISRFVSRPPAGDPGPRLLIELYTGHTRNHTTQSTYTPSSLIAHCVASVSSPHPYGHACSESPTLAPRKAREMSIDNPRITPAGRPASRCSARDPNQTAGAQRPSKTHSTSPISPTVAAVSHMLPASCYSHGQSPLCVVVVLMPQLLLSLSRRLSCKHRRDAWRLRQPARPALSLGVLGSMRARNTQRQLAKGVTSTRGGNVLENE